MPSPLAVLPMYDIDAVRAATDSLWVCLRDAIRGMGLCAPDALDRNIEPGAAWRSPGLILGQTCGMPFRLGMCGDAALLGAPDYGLDGCPAGYYCSYWVVRADDPREKLVNFDRTRLAVNALHSQSGFAAALASAGDARIAFTDRIETGAHASSMQAVAENMADIAAIDAVTWRLLQPQPHLRVLGRTAPTPGLPFITANGNDVSRLRHAASKALVSLPSEVECSLGIHGFVPFEAEDYLTDMNARIASSISSNREL